MNRRSLHLLLVTALLLSACGRSNPADLEPCGRGFVSGIDGQNLRVAPLDTAALQASLNLGTVVYLMPNDGTQCVPQKGQDGLHYWVQARTDGGHTGWMALIKSFKVGEYAPATTLSTFCGRGVVTGKDGQHLRSERWVADETRVEDVPYGQSVNILDCLPQSGEHGDTHAWVKAKTASGAIGWIALLRTFHVFSYLDEATISFPDPCVQQRNNFGGTGTVWTSMALDFAPFVGNVKGLVEFLSGCDMVTAQYLGEWRWLGAFSIMGLYGDIQEIAGVLEAVKTVNTVGKVIKASRLTKNELRTLVAVGKAEEDALGASIKAGKITQIEAQALIEAGRLEKKEEIARQLTKFDCSFDAETLVATETGSQPISAIVPGHTRVLALNAEKGTLGYYPVTSTNVHTDTTIRTLTVADDQIETTPNHRFFTPLGWREAGALQPGDRLLTASGYARPIQAITDRQEARAMYNLEVETAHTYFVGEGQWLVHNSCGDLVTPNGLRIPRSVAESWDRGTFSTVEEAIEYSFRRHGNGRSLETYTYTARNLFLNNRDRAQWGLWEAQWGESYKLELDGKTGYYTRDGRILALLD